MTTIRHMLWFDTQAEDAVDMYCEIFKESAIINKAQGADGKVFTVDFRILNQSYVALNGGPMFKHSEAFSIFVDCDGQEEVDYYWDAFISRGGSESSCGWLKDKFGISWQIIPRQLGEALGNPDSVKAAASMQAMMGMSKIIIAEL